MKKKQEEYCDNLEDNKELKNKLLYKEKIN